MATLADGIKRLYGPEVSEKWETCEYSRCGRGGVKFHENLWLCWHHRRLVDRVIAKWPQARMFLSL